MNTNTSGALRNSVPRRGIPGDNHYRQKMRGEANAKDRTNDALDRLSSTLRQCSDVLDAARKKVGDLQDFEDPYHPELGMKWVSRKEEGRRAGKVADFSARLGLTTGVVPRG